MPLRDGWCYFGERENNNTPYYFRGPRGALVGNPNLVGFGGTL